MKGLNNEILEKIAILSSDYNAGYPSTTHLSPKLVATIWDHCGGDLEFLEKIFLQAENDEHTYQVNKSGRLSVVARGMLRK